MALEQATQAGGAPGWLAAQPEGSEGEESEEEGDAMTVVARPLGPAPWWQRLCGGAVDKEAREATEVERLTARLREAQDVAAAASRATEREVEAKAHALERMRGQLREAQVRGARQPPLPSLPAIGIPRCMPPPADLAAACQTPVPLRPPSLVALAAGPRQERRGAGAHQGQGAAGQDL